MIEIYLYISRFFLSIFSSSRLLLNIAELFAPVLLLLVTIIIQLYYTVTII